MCGISGYLGRKSIDKELFTSAVNSLKHRGPDNEKVIFETHDKFKLNLALGHNRLSIIDLNERSNQPFIDGNQILVLNGEIYNFMSLRKDLKGKGVHFETKSDTELLIKLYKFYGIEEALNLIEGMFAFFIYDPEKGIAFLARDKFGIKPLLYYQSEEDLFFSSELKAIKKYFSKINFEISEEAKASFFYHRYELEPNSIFEDIKMLKSGHYLTYDLKNKSQKIKPYWSLDIKSSKNDENKVIDQVEELLFESVNENLISDVPVSLAFSGGLDSSLILAMAQKSNREIKAFTINRGDNDIDYKYAKKISRYLNLDLTPINFKDISKKSVDHLFSIYDQPIGCSSIFSTFALFREISKYGFKVTLLGDGGDELFGGYNWYNQYLKSSFSCKNLILNPKKVVKNNMLLNYQNEVERYKKIMLNRFSEEEIKDQLKIDSNTTCYRLYEDIMNEMGLDEIRTVKDLMAIDFNSFLKYALLRADFSSMANSIEARVPFLNTKLVEYAFKISPKLIHKNNIPKYILKKVAERYLPKELVYRPKKGFSSPVTNILPISNGQEFQIHIFNKWQEIHAD